MSPRISIIFVSNCDVGTGLARLDLNQAVDLAMAHHFGDTLGYNANVDVLDSPLIGVSVRPTAALGYRALVLPDLDGDGAGDIVLGGYSDDEGGEDAGAVTILGLPQ